jgi:tetratricopeptide (TPR) repeat protein
MAHGYHGSASGRSSCNGFSRILLALLSLVSLITSGQIPNITQQRTVDSLFVRLEDAEGTERVDILNLLSLNLGPRSFDSSFQYAVEALALSEELNYTFGKGVAIFNSGNGYFFKTDIKNALTKYLEAWRILEPYEPAREIADLLFQLGSINEYVQNTKKVLDYYRRSARNYHAVGDSASEALTLMTLGASYYYKLQALSGLSALPEEDRVVLMDSAIKFNDMARDFFLIPRKEDLWDVSQEDWLANVYNYYACYYQSKNDSVALDYYLKALGLTWEIADSNDRNFMEGLMCSNLGYHFYFFWNMQDTGLSYAIRGGELLQKTERYDIYSGSLGVIGGIYLEMGRLDDAKFNLLKALNVSDTFLLKVNDIEGPDPNFRLWSVTQNRSMRMEILNHLVKLYEKKGDYKNGLDYHKKLKKEISIQSKEELARQIIGMETEYEDDLKRQEIAGLARDNELNRLKLNRNRILFAGIGGVLLIILLVIIVWIQRQRFRSDHKAIVLEQKLLRAQMNPHFLFNSLYSIQNFIVTERPDKASIYLSKFAKLVRNILDNSTEEFVVLEKEISTIENYLEMQKVRFADKFDYHIDIDNDIDIDIVKIPPMLAQPFIENAIEHGIKHRETPGHINIRFSLKEQTLIFEVEDDGVGRQKAREIEIMHEPGHRSMATSLTRERLANLNRKLHRKIFLEIIDMKNALGEATGTRVVFGVPVGC